MPLQFRRDTTANITQFDPVLKQGEPLWDIDEKKLYIGDGENPATNLDSITGVTESEVGDVIAQIIDNGTSPNINFVYDSGDLALNVSLDFTTPLNSEIRSIAGFVGSLIGDDSVTVFESSESAFVNLQEAFLTDIGPRTDNAFDVGSATKRFKEGFFHNINVIDQTVVEDIVVNGLIKTEDSSILFDSRTSTLSADSIIGDLYGSVFGSDSTILVDSLNSSLRGRLVSDELTIDKNEFISSGSVEADPIFYIDNDLSFVRVRSSLAGIELRGIVDAAQPDGNNLLTSFVSRGTVSAPQIIQQGDSLGGNLALAYDGDDFIFTGFSGFVVDSNFTPAQGSVKSVYAISFSDRIDPNDNVFTADTRGIFTTPVAMQFTPLADAAARDAAISTPTAGMMVFVTSVAKFQGYDGTSWVDLN
jgi:hypothetical protein